MNMGIRSQLLTSAGAAWLTLGIAGRPVYIAIEPWSKNNTCFIQKNLDIHLLLTLQQYQFSLEDIQNDSR